MHRGTASSAGSALLLYDSVRNGITTCEKKSYDKTRHVKIVLKILPCLEYYHDTEALTKRKYKTKEKSNIAHLCVSLGAQCAGVQQPAAVLDTHRIHIFSGFHIVLCTNNKCK